MPGAEEVHEIGVELRAPAITGDMQRCFGATAVMKRLDDVGKMDKANGQS